MYNVLIVDDEKLIREGLARHVDWKSLDMEVIGVAEHAKRALEIVSQTPPDILITDIRMPNQDGFELIQDILELGLTPQTLLISSYDDFVYAQKAVRFSIIRDYILKPIDIDKFTDILKSVGADLKSQKTKYPAGNFADIGNYKTFLHDLRLSKYDRNKFISFIKVGDTTGAMEYWKIASQTIQDAHYPLSTVKCFCTSLIMAVMSSHIYQDDMLGTGLEEDLAKPIQTSLATVEELLSYMDTFITGRCNKALAKRENSKSKLISECLTIIDKEYCSCDFNLTALAASINVTPNYLSIKFKEELGVGFMKYLTEKQMEHAKKLLGDVRYKVYEVSYMVGYQDEKYFTRTFKKYEGVTPKEYREHHS